MSGNRDVAFIGLMYPEPTLKNIFGSLIVPPFRALQSGEWTLSLHKHNPRRIRGYFSPGYQTVSENWTLKHQAASDKEATTWMSLTPMELESQAHHALAAHGDVLIAGLGMGVLAWNVAMKSTVRSVTVVEHSIDIIEMVRELSATWPAWNKVHVVPGDALLYRDEHYYDYALFDIWPAVGDDRLREETKQMARNIRAREYASWGLEFDFVSWLSWAKISPRHVSSRHWSDYSDFLGVPLILRREPAMASLAFQAVVQGMKHEGDKFFGHAIQGEGL